AIPKLKQRIAHENDDFVLFPNPVTHGSNVRLLIPSSLSGRIAINLVDGLGRQIRTLSQTVAIGQVSLDLTELIHGLAPGKYTLQLIPMEGERYMGIGSLSFLIKP
ncbi:MAG: hypothetical protein ACKOAV_11100, partial [Bacteroidota bacterium]